MAAEFHTGHSAMFKRYRRCQKVTETGRNRADQHVLAAQSLGQVVVFEHLLERHRADRSPPRVERHEIAIAAGPTENLPVRRHRSFIERSTAPAHLGDRQCECRPVRCSQTRIQKKAARQTVHIHFDVGMTQRSSGRGKARDRQHLGDRLPRDGMTGCHREDRSTIALHRLGQETVCLRIVFLELGEQDVIANCTRAGLCQTLQHACVHPSRPGPASQTLQAEVVDRHDRDQFTRPVVTGTKKVVVYEIVDTLQGVVAGQKIRERHRQRGRQQYARMPSLQDSTRHRVTAPRAR